MNEKVRIIGKDHPHKGETGIFTGKVITVVGKKMAEIKLDNCPHLCDACFVKPEDIKEIR